MGLFLKLFFLGGGKVGRGAKNVRQIHNILGQIVTKQANFVICFEL
jgi:hypothetical protein